MLKIQFKNQMNFWTKTTVFNVFLVANPLVWYYSVLIYFQNNVSDSIFWVIHFSALIVSAIVGASLSKKIDRVRLLFFWIIFSTIASFSLLFLDNPNPFITNIVGLLLGIALGLGMPTCMSLFTDFISIENRGRVSGITMLLTGIGIFAFSVAQINQVLVLVLTLASWRIVSLIFLTSNRSSFRAKEKTKIGSFRQVLSQKSFLLYFVPWFMFSLVNYLTAPLVSNAGIETDGNVLLLQTVFMGIFAVLGGFFIDTVGRKRVAIAGFVMLGIGTAVLAVAPNNAVISYFNAASDGIAWGFLLVLFILTLWGDLSNNSQSDKYYAIGVLPFFISMLLERTAGEYLETLIVDYNEYAFFSFTAFFLFIAVLPLVYAPETLPEKTMKDRDLNSYIEKAKKIAEKNKEQKPEKVDTHDDNSSGETQESPEDKKARELAEKYY
jgi:MFS family permease